MDRDLAVTRVQEGLGFRSDQVSTIISRLQEAQRELERGKTLPKFLLVEDQTLSFLQATSSVALPSNFLRRAEKELRYRPSETDKYAFVPWKNYNDAYKAYSNVTASGPKVASLRTSSIFFFPEADRDYTLYWDYYVKDDLLTSNIENLWLANAPELLIGFAGARIARDDRNKSAEALFGTMYNEARLAWFNETVVEEAEDDIVLGADN